MEKYKEIYRALLKLCENEGLRLIEAELGNEGIVACFYKGYIILNSKYKQKDKILF